MIMYRKCKMQKTTLKRVATDTGESIEEMLRRLTANKEQPPQNVPEIYTDKKDGVIADYDIRTDRFDIAIEAQDKFSASDIAKAAGEPIEEVTNNNQEENKE